MGLDLELVQQPAPEEVLCCACHKVLTSPVRAAACPHLFCAACFTVRLRTGGSTCPACHRTLSGAPQPASVEVKIKLLNLLIKCNHNCGQVVRLAELPDHVAERCPMAPVSCLHSTARHWRPLPSLLAGGPAGCPMKVKRSELAEHLQECEYRLVVCEACGQQVTFRDLFTHQSRKRCLEKKLRQQLVKAAKLASMDVKQHRRSLERQHVRLEQQQRQRILDHFRHTADPGCRPQQQLHPTTSSNSGKNGNHDGQCEQNHDDKTHGQQVFRLPMQSAVLSHANPRQMSPGPVSAGHKRNSKTIPPFGDVFLTSVAQARHMTLAAAEEGLEFLALGTSSSSFRPPLVATCRKCRKQFRTSLNSPTSCRWHAGPIIELFSGTCYACGRLDYQPGCMMGCHLS